MRSFRRLALGLAVVGLLGLPSVGLASPATWSLERLSLGADAKGAVLDADGVRSTAFLPGVYLSWSATSQLSVAGTFERDFARDVNVARGGVRFLIARMGDGGQVGAGAGVVGYSGAGSAGVAEPTSWEASLHGAYPVWESGGRTAAWGIVSASFDPENGAQVFKVGLRAQLVGGRESVAVSGAE